MKILLLAGERSGKIYADRLKKLLHAEYRGYEDFFKIEDLAVMGFGAVVRRLGFFLRVRRTMIGLIDEWCPDVVVTIDYPGLNLKLAAYAKSKGIPTIHVVCPQVWAWKRGRIPKIPKMVDRLLCFFPFEPSLFKAYESESFKAKFIGHPLVDIFKEEREAEEIRLPWVKASKRVALLPGSRAGEIQMIFPELLKAASLLERRLGEGKVSFVVPAASSRSRVDLLSRLDMAEVRPHNIMVVEGRARQVLMQADAAAVASGTATLEAALARTPTTLVYRVSLALELFARMVFPKGFKLIGIANIIAGREVMPELIQRRFTAENVANQLAEWLGDEEAYNGVVAQLDETMRSLETGADGALMNVVREIRELVAE